MTKTVDKRQFVPEDPDDHTQRGVVEDANTWLDDLRRIRGREVTHAEMVLLEHGLRLDARLVKVGNQLAADGLTVEGSAGQTKLHPLVDLERELREELLDVFGRLGLVGETAA